MPDELKPEQIAKIVSAEDAFAHEMKTGAILREFPRFTVFHGGTYSDEVTEIPRQFDFRAILEFGSKYACLAVEAKGLSPASPMVISGCPRRQNESYHELVRSRFEALTTISETLVVEFSDPIYPIDGFCGKSILRFQSDGKGGIKAVSDEDIYKKWSQALSSCVDLVHSATDFGKSSGGVATSAVIPIVVVPDGVLWKCEYDDSGSMTGPPTLADEIMLFVGRSIKTGSGRNFHALQISHVHFCTLQGFRAFLEKLISKSEMWNQLFSPFRVRN